MSDRKDPPAQRFLQNTERWLLLGVVTFLGVGLAVALGSLVFAAPTVESRVVWVASASLGGILLLVWYLVVVSRIRDS